MTARKKRSSKKAQRKRRTSRRTIDVDPRTLTPHPTNSRAHTDAHIAEIAGSIHAYGFNRSVTIDEKSVILAGHGAVRAAIAVGLRKIPATQVRGLTENQKRAYVIAENKIAENATWNEEQLTAELTELSKDADIDLTVMGFDEKEIEKYIGDPSNAAATPKQAGSGNGDDDNMFAVIVECETADAASELFERLDREGFECRIVN